MSASLRKADIAQRCPHVRFVPISDLGCIGPSCGRRVLVLLTAKGRPTASAYFRGCNRCCGLDQKARCDGGFQIDDQRVGAARHSTVGGHKEQRALCSSSLVFRVGKTAERGRFTTPARIRQWVSWWACGIACSSMPGGVVPNTATMARTPAPAAISTSTLRRSWRKASRVACAAPLPKRRCQRRDAAGEVPGVNRPGKKDRGDA